MSSLSIGITTFKYRYDKYFVPLIDSIKNLDPEIEVIIAINGEHNENFDNDYRSKILSKIAVCKNTFPILFPEFRGLSKLWNSIVIHSSSDYILLLNDDVTINASNFIYHVKECIDQVKTSFKINGSWSHVVLKKSEVENVGFFDERLCALSEEDGVFEWHYNDQFNKSFLNLIIPNIINHVDMTHTPTNIIAGTSGKYSKFNRDYVFNKMFTIDQLSGKSYGMIEEKLIYNGGEKQYPYEKFWRNNKEKI